MHKVTLQGGKELYNLTREGCKHSEMELIISSKGLIDVTTDGKEFFQISTDSKRFYQAEMKEALLNKRKQTSLLLAILFWGLASIIYYKNNKIKKIGDTREINGVSFD